MDLEELAQLSIINGRALTPRNNEVSGKVSALVNTFNENSEIYASKKIGPTIPPKPFKKSNDFPEVPQSSLVKQACEPRYSKRLEWSNSDSPVEKEHIGGVILQRKQPIYASSKSLMGESKVTLDNPAVLEQQLEALTHHKKQLEKQKLLQSSNHETKKPQPKLSGIPKLSSTSLISDQVRSSDLSNIYSNIPTAKDFKVEVASGNGCSDYAYKNKQVDFNVLYSNSPQQSIYGGIGGFYDSRSASLSQDNDDDVPSPPSPVSSSYSELRRATDVFIKKPMGNYPNYGVLNTDNSSAKTHNPQTYSNVNYGNDFSIYSPTMQSSTYESIYEPINPRPPSQLSSRSNYTSYNPYVNELPLDKSVEDGISLMSSNSNMQLYAGNSSTMSRTLSNSSGFKKEDEVNELTDYLVHSMEDKSNSDPDSYGICFKCNEPVMGENSGCTAMEHIYHISCFTCSQCQINLQGKPFYALEGSPFCEYDYLQTLEKCSVCMQPILERILRATGKPYHPQCFTCVVCNRSLDGIPFTVDATNKNYCIADFHKKFAPRCCVCKEPIMPEPGEEETVRVVALDRSFHFECYKCEDCGLLLSSEEGRGCYPLDDHVLCKSCNAQRVQLLTNRIE